MNHKKPFSSTPQRRYTGIAMRMVIILTIAFCLPTLGFAQIPNLDNLFGGQQNTNPYGAQQNPYGNTGYNPYAATDPYLAQSRMSPSSSANTQSDYNRIGKFVGLGASLLQVFTGKGTFGQKVQFLVLDQLNTRFAQPMYQQAEQAMSLENLYRLANQGMSGPQGYTQGQAQCLDCITPNPNGWQPGGGTNGQSMNDAFTSFSAVGGGGSGTSTGRSSGGAGVVSAIK